MNKGKKMEFLLKECHIINYIISNLSEIKNCSNVFLNIVTGVGIIKGFNYLKELKAKKSAATFTFWSQLRIRVYELLNWLQEDYSLIDNLYDSNIRNSWESSLSPNKDRIESYKKKVEEVIIYIESTPDQMPAYIGWTADYTKILEFLNDLIQYDICNAKEYFKFTKDETINHRNDYCKNICEIMKRLCNEIENKQKEIEEKLL